MSKAKHSPAPWAVHDGGRFGTYGDFGPTICKENEDGTCQPLFEMAGPSDPNVCEANAILASAAPDILEALELMVACHCGGPAWEGNSMTALATAKRAIAKATGEEDAS